MKPWAQKSAPSPLSMPCARRCFSSLFEAASSNVTVEDVTQKYRPPEAEAVSEAGSFPLSCRAP